MIHKIEEQPTPTPPSQISEPDPVIPKETKTDAKDPRYFKLTKPITIGQKTIDRLLVVASELTGHVYFNLVARFRKEYPDEYRLSFNKLSDELFLSYVVAELNPPMVVEDVRKISFKDLPLIFMTLAGFLFGARPETATKE